jgi:hypothetical protein
MSRFRKGKRKQRRAKMLVPVRVRRMGAGGASQTAYTLDATQSGVRVAGLKGEFNPSDIIEIQYRNERAMFRVVWVAVPADSSEKHLGAECVDSDRNIWGEDFPKHPDEYEEAEL